MLHMCLIDAAVTADNFAMLFSKMADDERFETFDDDYLHVGDAEETESEDESASPDNDDDGDPCFEEGCESELQEVDSVVSSLGDL